MSETKLEKPKRRKKEAVNSNKEFLLVAVIFNNVNSATWLHTSEYIKTAPN